jgi:DNA polymerase III subunit epsilon
LLLRAVQDDLAGRILAGCRFNRKKIEALLAQTDLVVAHNVAFERPFLLPLFPQIAHLRWACSLADIDWREGQAVPYPSIDGLLKAYKLGPTDKTPEGDCHALVRILSQLLPESLETRFHRLIVASARVSVECVVPDAGEDVRSELEALGFELQSSRWIAQREDAAAALALEMRVIDLAVNNPAFALAQMWSVDSTSRFGAAVEMASASGAPEPGTTP